MTDKRVEELYRSLNATIPECLLPESDECKKEDADRILAYGDTRAREAVEPYGKLVEAVRAVLKGRDETEWTYEDAYHFLFKGAGRGVWEGVIDTLATLSPATTPFQPTPEMMKEVAESEQAIKDGKMVPWEDLPVPPAISSGVGGEPILGGTDLNSIMERARKQREIECCGCEGLTQPLEHCLFPPCKNKSNFTPSESVPAREGVKGCCADCAKWVQGGAPCMVRAIWKPKNKFAIQGYGGYGSDANDYTCDDFQPAPTKENMADTIKPTKGGV